MTMPTRFLSILAAGFLVLCGAESQAANTLGFRGGFATRDDFDGRRYRLVGAIENEALLVSSNRLVIALFTDWENSLWWHDLSGDIDFKRWSGYETVLDLILAIGTSARAESEVQFLLGLGGAGKVSVSSVLNTPFDDFVEKDVDITETGIGPVVQAMIRVKSPSATMSGMLRYRYLTGKLHADGVSHNVYTDEYGEYEVDFRARYQTLTMRGQAELRTKPARLLIGLQLERQRTITKSEVAGRWPDWGGWDYDWDIMLYGGLRIDL